MYRIAAALLALSVTQQEAPTPATDPATAPVEVPAPARPRPDAPPVGSIDGPAPAPPRREVRSAPSGPSTLDAPARREAASPPVTPAPARARPQGPPPESREALLGAALAFADALVRGDAAGLCDASSSRFSFDGVVVDGRDAQLRRWREILAARRPPVADSLRDLVLLRGEEAVAQLGPPPARLAPWARPEAWIAVADVSGRPVLLLVGQDGGRWVVSGMSD